MYVYVLRGNRPKGITTQISADGLGRLPVKKRNNFIIHCPNLNSLVICILDIDYREHGAGRGGGDNCLLSEGAERRRDTGLQIQLPYNVPALTI